MTWLMRPATETQITHRARLWLYTTAFLVMVFLVIPTLLVIPMSFSASQYLEFPPSKWSLRWYESYFNSKSWMDATATSLKAGVLTALFLCLCAAQTGQLYAGFGACPQHARYTGGHAGGGVCIEDF